MSGALSTVSRAGSIVSGVSQAVTDLSLFFAGGTNAGGVTIAGVDLRDFEIPENMPWGSEQELIVHKLPGGQKVIQTMGSMPLGTITWSGQMIGPDAVDRADTLDQLTDIGTRVQLTFGPISYDCVVRSFKADYRKQYWMGHYEISVETLPSSSNDASTDPIQNASGGLSDALSTVQNGLASLAQSARQVVTTAQGALNVVGSVTNALGISSPFLGQAAIALGSAQAGVGALGSLSASVGATSAAAASMSGAGTALAGCMVASGGALGAIATQSGGSLCNPDDAAAAADAAGGLAISATALGYAGAAQQQINIFPGSTGPQSGPVDTYNGFLNLAEAQSSGSIFQLPSGNILLAGAGP